MEFDILSQSGSRVQLGNQNCQRKHTGIISAFLTQTFNYMLFDFTWNT